MSALIVLLRLNLLNLRSLVEVLSLKSEKVLLGLNLLKVKKSDQSFIEPKMICTAIWSCHISI